MRTISLPSFTSFFHSLCHCIRDATLGAGQEKKLARGKGASTCLLSSPAEPSRIYQRCIMYYHISVTLSVSWVKKPEKPSSGCTCRSHSIKIDCGVHVKSLFLWLLPVLVQCQTGGYNSMSAVMVLGKVNLARMEASPGGFCFVKVAI